jgi:hypothetical protein
MTRNCAAAAEASAADTSAGIRTGKRLLRGISVLGISDRRPFPM